MRINHNIQALNAYRNLSKNQGTISKHMEKLSSGLRINHAADDAAGLAISEKMRTQIRGLQAAERNSMDGISLVQTAEGALDSVQAMLQRMRELAVQAANDTSTTSDRMAIQDEINQLTSEINRVGNSIEFNSRKLLDGTISSSNFSNVGRLKGGAEAIPGVKANGTLTVGTGANSFVLRVDAVDDGTDLNGYKIMFGVDSNSPGSTSPGTYTVSTIVTSAVIDPIVFNASGTTGNVTITPAGEDLEGYTFEFLADTGSGAPIVVVDTSSKAITIEAHWSVTPPLELNDIETAINTALIGETPPLATISLAVSGTFDPLDLENKGPTSAITVTTPAVVRNDVITITPPIGNTDLSGVSFVFASGSNGSATTVLRSGDTITITADFSASGVKADIANTLKANYDVMFDFAGDAADLDGKTITMSKTNVNATLAGRTITVTADWDNSTGSIPKSLDDIQRAINVALRAEGRGEIELSLVSGAIDFSKLDSAGEISLLGGVTAVDAKPSTQVLSVNARPNEKDILIINDVKIGFWDSSKLTYGDEATAKDKLGTDVMINIYNGMRYLESYEIASQIAALGTVFTDVEVLQSEAGSDLIITANTPGKVSNNIRTDYFPTIDAGLNLQIGANTGQKLVVDIPNIRAQSLKITGITAGGEVISADGKTKAFLTEIKTVNNGLDAELVEYAIDISTHEHASAAITIFGDALNRVSAARSKLGAFQNRLEYTVSNLSQTAENVTAAESRIRDADMALEITNYTKNNIISQAAQAMLAQANQLPQGLLQLLQ